MKIVSSDALCAGSLDSSVVLEFACQASRMSDSYAFLSRKKSFLSRKTKNHRDVKVTWRGGVCGGLQVEGTFPDGELPRTTCTAPDAARARLAPMATAWAPRAPRG